MDILTVVIIVFVVLEVSNVLMLYLSPETKMGNGVGVFNAYRRSKKDPAVHALVVYLVNWVAGTKLIFIVLLIGILIAGSPALKIFSVIALIFSISTFFFRLYPIIKKMDESRQLTPRGYSKTLLFMIIAFVAVFAIALAVYLIFYR